MRIPTPELIVLALLLFTIVSQSIAAQTISFFPRGVSADNLSRYFDLNTPPTIKGLGDRVRANYPNLTVLEIPADLRDTASPVVRFYDRLLRGRAEGNFIAAGQRLASHPDRPLDDRDLITYRSGVPAYIVLHEVLHYLLEVEERDLPSGSVAIENRLRAVDAGELAALDEVEMLSLHLDMIRRSSLEEVALVDFMVRHRQRLNLSTEDVFAELEFGGLKFVKASGDLEALVNASGPLTERAGDRALPLLNSILKINAEMKTVAQSFIAAHCELNLR